MHYILKNCSKANISNSFQLIRVEPTARNFGSSFPQSYARVSSSSPFPRCPKIYNVYYLTCIVLFTTTFLTQTAPYFCLDPEITHPDNVRYSSSTLQSLICDCIKYICHRTLVFGLDLTIDHGLLSPGVVQWGCRYPNVT